MPVTPNYMSYESNLLCGGALIADCASPGVARDLAAELNAATTAVAEARQLLENAEYADGQAVCLTQDCEALEAALNL